MHYDTYAAFEAITARIAGTAVWRRSMASKFPDDNRNVPAAVRLEELAAADSRDVQPDTWARLAYSDPRFTVVLNETAREVGFRSKPPTLDHFIRAVADRLSPVGAL